MGNANSSTKIAEKLDKRKCIFADCKGEMELRKVIPGNKMMWVCLSKVDEHRVPKLPNDYGFADRDADYRKKE